MKPIMHGYQPKPRRSCDELGVCQGRKTPCLNCKAPDADPWPPEQDTFTRGERMVYPLLQCAAIGVVLGIAYGLARYYMPGWFY